MKLRAAFVASVAILLSTVSLRAAALDYKGAIVLCYHIVESPQDPRMEISREAFRQQMRYLAVTGYNVIPLREAYEYAVGKRASLPPRSVVVTIDDGWRSTYTEVFPEMKRRHLPFTIFIYPRIVGQTTHALTWKMIKEMSEAGVDVESHSFSHPFLTQRRHTNMGPKEYAAWLEHELLESRKTIERETGKPAQFLAYPYGDYDHFLVANVAKAGYLAALTCDYGSVRRGSDPLRMRRFVIEKRMDFAAFRHYLGAKPMQLADMAPQPGHALDPGVTSVTVSAKIPSFKMLDPKSVGMTLMSSAAAGVPFSYDPHDGSISLTIKEVLKGFQRALVWGTDAKSGRRVEATWTFRIPEPAAVPPAAVPASTPLAPAAPAAETPTPVASGSGTSGGGPHKP